MLMEEKRDRVLGRCGVSKYSDREKVYFEFYNPLLGIGNDKDCWNIDITNNVGVSSYDSGWNAAPGTIGVIAHEFGHSVCHYFDEMFGEGNYHRDFGLYGQSRDAVSKYATCSPDEAFAEAFSMFATGVQQRKGSKVEYEKFRSKMKQYGFGEYEGCLAKYVPNMYKKDLRPEFRQGKYTPPTETEAPMPRKSSVKKTIAETIKERVNTRKQVEEVPDTPTPKVKTPKPKAEKPKSTETKVKKETKKSTVTPTKEQKKPTTTKKVEPKKKKIKRNKYIQ